MTAAASSLIVALALAALVQLTGAKTVVEGLWVGLLVGTGFVAPSHAASYSFEGKTLVHFLINAGYSVVALPLLGVLLTLWK